MSFDEEHIDPHGECAAEIHRLQSALSTAQARIAELEGALKPFVEGAGHTRVFLTSREKMHPDGVALYDEDVARARVALSPHAPDAAQKKGTEP